MVMTTAERSKRHKDKDPDAYRAKKREYIKSPEVREKRRLEQAAWREKNREHYNEWARNNHQKNKEKIKPRARNYALKSKYGITQSDYEQMVIEQGGACAICKTTEFTGNGKKLHVDHDHKTGKVRGLLCYTCNTKLAWHEENAAAIALYLSHNELEEVSK